ncbi:MULTISPECIES: hypothetical protein [Burkholderia]|uniref:hypothetical protein n=1 Tax=Burkholderia TaxID=32008 RepID=UPI0012BC1289|nr:MULTISPECIES: hypothetical protein [Burkholderia]
MRFDLRKVFGRHGSGRPDAVFGDEERVALPVHALRIDFDDRGHAVARADGSIVRQTGAGIRLLAILAHSALRISHCC